MGDRNSALTGMFVGILFLVIGVSLLTSFAGTVHTATDTSAGKALENVSATAKTIWSFTDLAWAGGSIAFILLGIFGVAVSAKKMVEG